MQFVSIDKDGVYLGMVDGVVATSPDVGYYPPEGTIVAPYPPPEDTPNAYIFKAGDWLAYGDEDKYNAERAAVETKYSASWDGVTGGILTLMQMTIVAALAAGTDTANLYAQYQAELSAMYAEFDTIDQKYGVA